MSKLRVLVTGCTGMVGTRVVEQLTELCRSSPAARDSLSFRFAVRQPSTIRVPEAVDGEAVALDFGEVGTHEAALSGIDRAFVLYHPQNSAAMPAFFESMHRAGVRHVVMMTVIHADSLSILPHHKAEKQLQACCANGGTCEGWEDMEPVVVSHPPDTCLTDSSSAAAAASTTSSSSSMTFTFVRPSWFMENLTRPGIHLPDIVETNTLYMPAGDGRVHLVHGSDVGEVIARILCDSPSCSHPRAALLNTAVELTGDVAPTFGEIAEAMTEVLGRPIQYQSAWLLPFVWHMAFTRGLPWSLCLVMCVEYGYGVAGGRSQHLTSDVAQLLGKKPRGLRAFLEERRSSFEPDRR